MVVKAGTEAADKLVGTAKQNDLHGNGGNDTLEGLGSNDVLFGGDGDDVLNGGDGKDILRGQRGGDQMDGGGNDDVLYALGNRRNTGQIIRDKIFELTGGIVSKSPVDPPDIMIGGEGEDLFIMQRNKPREGLGFYRGQQYAVIKDFTSGEDKIYLLGGHNNYVGVPYGDDNEDTAILYVEDHDDFSGIDRYSQIEDKSLQVSEGTALVAIVENATVRNMMDSDFYAYEKVSMGTTSSGFNPIIGIIVGAIAIGSIIAFNLKKIN